MTASSVASDPSCMKGPRRAISRRPGVLNACFILMTPGRNSPRPISALGKPTSWKPSLVKFQPSWQVHPARRLDGPERLIFEIGLPPVPHEDLAPGAVDDGRRTPTELRHAMADSDRQPVAPAKTRAVAAGAGLRRGHRQPRVEIEL